MISRGIAIVPAIAAICIYGERGTGRLLLFSQVVLSAQLAFAVIPLVHFTSDRTKMGGFVNSAATRVVGWSLAAAIVGLNAYLIFATLVPSAVPR
jgi:manganese transport protein